MQDEQSIFTETGRLENSCPYCSASLEKRPSKKTKCPTCGQSIYARTRPYDRLQVLATKTEAELIDRQRHITAGIHDAFIYDEKVLEATRSSLSRRLQRQPTDFEVKAEICFQQQATHSSQWDWGLYRNDRFQIAEFQRAAGRVGKALAIYHEVCYIDLNGPNNSGALREWPDLMKEHPPFRPDPQGLAPAVVDLLNGILIFLAVDPEEIKDQFLEVAKRVQKEIGTPLEPGDAWLQLQSRIHFTGRIQ
jgi:hypothetical protein